MGKYIKNFENHAAYIAAKSGLMLPNVSLCVQENEVHYNQWYETKIVAKFNISDISTDYLLLAQSGDNYIKSMEIDGEKQQSLVYRHTFDSVGEHIVKYELKDPESIGRCLAGVDFSSIYIPKTITSFLDNSFRGCGLTSITFNSSVVSIGDSAFYSNRNLQYIMFEGTTPPTVSSSAFGQTNNCPIYVPSESVDLYKSSMSSYASRIYATTPTQEFTYVDLGLPSGIKWATTNMGALNITEYGDYYKFSELDNFKPFYNIPTAANFQELINNTTFQFIENFNGSGVNGGKFTAQNGNYVFFPASGEIHNDGVTYDLNEAGNYFSTVLDDMFYCAKYDGEEAACGIEEYAQTNFKYSVRFIQ